MGNIVKCSHCKKIMPEEAFDSHKCNLPVNGVKQIPVAYFRDDSYGSNKRITGRGIDGVLYTFIVEKREAIRFILSSSNEFLQGKESDKDFTEPLHSMEGPNPMCMLWINVKYLLDV